MHGNPVLRTVNPSPTSALPAGPTSQLAGRWLTPATLIDSCRKKPEVGVPGATYSDVIQLLCGSKGINRHGGKRRGQVAQSTRARRPIRASGQDASRMGVEGDRTPLRQDRPTCPLST